MFNQRDAHTNNMAEIANAFKNKNEDEIKLHLAELNDNDLQRYLDTLAYFTDETTYLKGDLLPSDKSRNVKNYKNLYGLVHQEYRDRAQSKDVLIDTLNRVAEDVNLALIKIYGENYKASFKKTDEKDEKYTQIKDLIKIISDYTHYTLRREQR